MTQSELGERIGVTNNYISQIESGRPGKEQLGELTEMRFRSLEDSPIYADRNWREMEAQTQRTGAQRMGPPHYLYRSDRQVDVSPTSGALSPSDYAQTTNWLSFLFDNDHQAFLVAKAAVKGIYDLSVTKESQKSK